MTELVVIIFSAALVNNFVLVQFLGLCPFLGASRKLEGALGMGLATGLVLTLASAFSYLVERFVLIPFDVTICAWFRSSWSSARPYNSPNWC